MTDFKKNENTLEERAFETARTLLVKYHNPHNQKLEENAVLDESYTILITLLYTQELTREEQVDILSIIDEMKLLDGNR